MVVIGYLLPACKQVTVESKATSIETLSPLEQYVAQRSKDLSWDVIDTVREDGYTLYVLRYESQRWLSENEVKDPVWWHWLRVVVPDSIKGDKGMLFIGGGNRQRATPESAGEPFVQIARHTHSIVADLHNVPNQPLEFVDDSYGPRVEDEIIAYGWRKFLEGGAKDKDIKWLARMPMTTASVTAMDVLQSFSRTLDQALAGFVIAGASKRGWTTWTTGLDSRVIAIAPVVIDMLNLEPSFQHHWQAYGRWAPAVGNYQNEGIMEWQGSKEYERLIELTEPYSFRHRLTIPKFIINATGDQFFLPDSWQFYWNGLAAEKHLRYVPNSEHSMRETDAWQSLLSFYYAIIRDRKRPDYYWEVKDGVIHIDTRDSEPLTMTLWQSNNPEARNFQVDSIGRAYEASDVPISEHGKYKISIPTPEEGWSAFFVELTFQTEIQVPLKFTTGVVVAPDEYPFEPYQSSKPMGTR